MLDYENIFAGKESFSASAVAEILKVSPLETTNFVFNDASVLTSLTTKGQFCVVDVNDQYILRFPKNNNLKDKNNISLEDLRSESKVTNAIFPFIKSTRISKVSLVEGEYPFAIHEKIKGTELTKSDYDALPKDKKILFATELATFLAELHSIPLNEVHIEDKRHLDPMKQDKQQIREILRQYGISLHPHNNSEDDLVCCHNDIHPGNIGVDLSNNVNILQGVFDFGISGVNTRTADFYKIYDFDKNLCQNVINHYNQISEKKVNISDVENQFLCWCALNIQSAEGKIPQIVDAMEKKLALYKQHKNNDKNTDIDKISVLRGISQPSQASDIREASTKPYRRVIDIEKLGRENFLETKYLWALSLARTVDNPKFANLTPHQHKRHSRFAAVLLGAYSTNVFYKKHSERQLRNLKSYLSPKNTKERVDFWCDFLDSFEHQLRIHLPKAKIEYMDVGYPRGKKRSGENRTPATYKCDGKLEVIDISKLNEIKDKYGKPIKCMHFINKMFTTDSPIYLKRHSMPEAEKQLKFNADIITAYDNNLNTDVVKNLKGTKAMYNLQGKGITYDGQQMYIRFLNELEKYIKNIHNVDS